MRTGFLLLEMSFVLIFFTLGIFFTAPSFLFFKKKLVNVEIESLYARLSYLQAKAITNNSSIEIIFDEQANTYELEGCKFSLSKSVYFGFRPGVLGPPSRPKTPLACGVNFPQKKMVFHGDGSMQAGALYLTNEEKNLLYALTVPIGYSCLRKYCYDFAAGRWILLQ